jgi:hypothetical protein
MFIGYKFKQEDMHLHVLLFSEKIIKLFNYNGLRHTDNT